MPSMMENLFRLPQDLKNEVAGLFGSKPKGEKAAQANSQSTEKIKARALTQREKDQEDAERLKKQIDDEYNQLMESDIPGSRIAPTLVNNAQERRIQTDEQRRLRDRQRMLVDALQQARNEQQKKQYYAELTQVEEQLRQAA